MSKEVFNLSVEGIIWKIYHDAYTNNLLIENRIETPRGTFFHLISPQGALLSTWEPQEENWWFNTIKFHNNEVFLTLYPNEDLPETSHLHRYNAENGNLINSIENCSVFFSDLHEITYKQNEDILKISLAPIPQSSSTIQSPHVYTKETEYFETVKNYIEKEQGIEPVESIEYLEHSNSIIISYYLYNENKKLDNYLLLLDKEGEITYQDCISGNNSGIGTDSFFVLGRSIYFTQNKTAFICINL